MESNWTINQMRADFVVRRRGALALPVTGIIVYSAAALLSLLVQARFHNLMMTLCFWTIPPVGAFISKLRGEMMGGGDQNPLMRLGAFARVMVLSTWSIHIPVWIFAPALFPITVGIAFALHWAIFSWTLGHPVGFIHLALRIVLVLAAWIAFPANRVGAVCAGIAIAYLFSAIQLRRIDWQRRLNLDIDPWHSRPTRNAWPGT